MFKRIVCTTVCFVFIFCLCSCGKENNETPDNVIPACSLPLNTKEYIEAPTTTTPQTTQEDITFEATIVETLPITELATVPTPQEPQTEITTAPKPSISVEKTGEMAFSDQPDNRYISAITSKYGVDAKKLVALYTVPENDSNIVLEFDGTENSDGSLVRNKSTLVAIYSIDKELNSKRASEDKALNEYSYGEMKVMFFTTTTYIMTEFEELK